ncbi:MAG TPA: DUF6152 family protein [Gammaproteobacteria bacterium]
MHLKTLFAVVLGWLALPALAHHSHGNYQMTEYTHLEGVVTEFIFMNPHSWVYMEVEDEAGEKQVWALETASVQALTRNGVSADTLVPGDRISVRCHQLKDGANGCLLGFLTPPGGEESEWD